MPYNFCLWYFDQMTKQPDYSPAILHFAGTAFKLIMYEPELKIPRRIPGSPSSQSPKSAVSNNSSFPSKSLYLAQNLKKAGIDFYFLHSRVSSKNISMLKDLCGELGNEKVCFHEIFCAHQSFANCLARNCKCPRHHDRLLTVQSVYTIG